MGGLHGDIRGICGLCKKRRVLRQSHIVPALVARWIKKDAPGTLFVNIESGRTRQDISKRRLFCDECEQTFSRWERPFRNEVFDAYFKNRTNFSRAEWLTRFATSLAFRVAVATLPTTDLGSKERRQLTERMVEEWRCYLLSPPGTPPPSEHEILFLDGKKIHPPTDIDPQFTGEYLIGAVDATPVASGDVVAVYTKLPGILFWSPIHPRTRVGWRGTRVSGSGTIRANKQTVTDPLLKRLVHERIRTAHEKDVQRERKTRKSRKAG